jgi:hypothetical protein
MVSCIQFPYTPNAIWLDDIGDLPAIIFLPPSIVCPVADVLSGRVVVSPVNRPELGNVQVHRDGQFL